MGFRTGRRSCCQSLARSAWRPVCPGAVCLALAAAAPALPAQIHAQEPIARYWSALENASTVDELARVEPPSLASEHAGIAPSLRAVRLYELERDRTVALIARRDLENLVDRTRSAWAHFALGVALARGPDLRHVIGADPDMYVAWEYSNAALRAPRELRRALELDATLHPAAHALAELALDLGHEQLLKESLAALSHESRAADPRSVELTALVLTQLDEVEDAADHAAELRRLGGDPSVALHIGAAALLRTSHRAAEGSARYFTGVEELTDAGADAYFNALYPILTPPEVERWESADLMGRREFLYAYWNMRAALAGVPVEERLAEHYRRLAIIRSRGRTAPMGAGAGGIGLGDVRRFGVPSVAALNIVRHGDPFRVERILLCGPDVVDIPLPLAPPPGECAKTPMGRMRARVAGESAIPRYQAQNRAVAGTTYAPPFRAYLQLAWDLIQFRGERGATQLVAAVGVHTSSARELVINGVATARVELSLIDTASMTVERDTRIRSFNAGRLPDNGWMLLQGILETTSDTRREFRIGVTDEARTAGGIVGGSITPRRFSGDSLMLSDVVIAPLDGAPSFTRGDVRLSLAPLREFTRDETFALYYEIYGLARDMAYRTDIVVRPREEGLAQRLRALLPGDREALHLSFLDATTEDPHPVLGVQQSRTVSLGGLLPGTYDIVIRVTDHDGRITMQERRLHVRDD